MRVLLLVTLLATIRPGSLNAQGTIAFANIGPGLNAPVYLSDGVTKLSGPQFMAELLAGRSASSLSPIATTGFFGGAGAGYFNAQTQVVPWANGSSADVLVQVLVWNTKSGASFDQALASGLPDSYWASTVFSVRPGDPAVPTPAGILTGLGNSPVYLNTIPEPSTFALVGLGALMTLLRIRRNRAGASSESLR